LDKKGLSFLIEGSQDNINGLYRVLMKAYAGFMEQQNNGMSASTLEFDGNDPSTLDPHLGAIAKWATDRGLEPYRKPKQKGFIRKAMEDLYFGVGHE
jgi:hypothetical protein